MNKNLKKVIAPVAAAAMVFAVPTGVYAEDGAQEKITFCLDWTPNTNHTGLYVAQAKGYYEEAGLDVEIVQPPENGAALMCAAGQAQFAIEAQDTMAASLALDEPLGITAVVNGDGGDFSQVTLISTDITDEPAALAAKQTDAIWVFQGWGGINADVEGVDCDYFAFSDINPVFDYYTPVIIANNDYLAENPDQAKAFMEATAKGYEFAAENPDESAQILIDGDNTGSLKDAEDLVKKSQEFLSTKYIDDAESWGGIDADRWNAFYNWLYENQLCDKDRTGVGFSNDYRPQ